VRHISSSIQRAAGFHLARGDDGVARTKLLNGGVATLDPSGLELALVEIYAAG